VGGTNLRPARREGFQLSIKKDEKENTKRRVVGTLSGREMFYRDTPISKLEVMEPDGMIRGRNQRWKKRGEDRAHLWGRILT